MVDRIRTYGEYLDVQQRYLDGCREVEDARWSGKFGTAARIEELRIRRLRAMLEDYERREGIS